MSTQPPTGVADGAHHVSSEDKATYVFAGIGSRFVAILIDGILLGILTAALGGGHPGNTGLSAIIYIAYVTFMIGQYGQTVGKMAMKVRVVTVDGEHPSFATAFLRTISSYLSGAVFCIGYIWAFFNPKHQTWHDLIAGTYVVEDTTR